MWMKFKIRKNKFLQLRVKTQVKEMELWGKTEATWRKSRNNKNINESLGKKREKNSSHEITLAKICYILMWLEILKWNGF